MNHKDLLPIIIKELSGMKHFYNSIIEEAIEAHIHKNKILITPEQKEGIYNDIVKFFQENIA